MSWSFADWLAELTALRVARLDPGPDVGSHLGGDGRVRAADLYASLLEFPARIGAQLGGCTPGTARALREFGRECGQIILSAEDILALRGDRTRLDTTLAVMLDGRFSGIPDLIDEGPITAERLTNDLDLRSRAQAIVTAAGIAALHRARQALAAVPEPAAIRILTTFAETAAAPLAAPPNGVSRPASMARPRATP